MPKNFLNQLNIVSNCRRYGLSLWQCPQFLFLVMGAVIIITSVVSYLIGTYFIDDPEIVALIVIGGTLILFVIAFTMTRSFERLAEASRMKSEFIDIASHQLRSPLTNIKWTFELLTSKELEVPSEKVEEYLNNVKENIARMVELIDDLLIVSKIEQGSFPILKKDISLEELIKDLVSRFKVFADATHIELIFEPPENFPKIFADPSLLKLVIENLIDNAIRYTKGGGKVEINLERREKNICFSIKDTGLGIPQKEQKFIFRKFFRAENISKKQTRGSGLGLYVAKSVIKRSGGKIWFESEEGKGTTFFIILPIK